MHRAAAHWQNGWSFTEQQINHRAAADPLRSVLLTEHRLINRAVARLHSGVKSTEWHVIKKCATNPHSRSQSTKRCLTQVGASAHPKSGSSVTERRLIYRVMDHKWSASSPSKLRLIHVVIIINVILIVFTCTLLKPELELAKLYKDHFMSVSRADTCEAQLKLFHNAKLNWNFSIMP